MTWNHDLPLQPRDNMRSLRCTTCCLQLYYRSRRKKKKKKTLLGLYSCSIGSYVPCRLIIALLHRRVLRSKVRKLVHHFGCTGSLQFLCKLCEVFCRHANHPFRTNVGKVNFRKPCTVHQYCIYVRTCRKMSASIQDRST